MRNRRRFLEIARAVQKGQIPEESVSPNVKFVADHMTPAKLREFIREPTELPDFVKELVTDCNTERKMKKLSELMAKGDFTKINGVHLDRFSGAMLHHILEKLNPKQRKLLLDRPIEEAVAIAYKLASRSME